MEKKSVSKNVIWGLVGISFLMVVILILAFVIFFNSPKEIKQETVDAGNVSMTYTDDINGLSITNAVPTTDQNGMIQSSADQYFDFTVNVDITEANAVDYEIAVIKDTKTSTAMDENIKVYLEQQKSGSYVKVDSPKTLKFSTKKSKLGSPKNSMVIATVTKKKSTVDNYRLRMWLSDQTVLTEGAVQNYTIKVLVNGKAR